jgi:formylglycine-generating enzyme required for sulfatase activity
LREWKVRFPRIIAATWLTLICALVPAHAEKRVALVVGNDRYANLPAHEQLQKAVSDARAVGKALERLGFEVMSGENADRTALVDKLDAFARRLGQGDTAFFFFSGHGVALGGVNYILPADVPNVDADQETRLARFALSEHDIVSDLQARGVRVAVVVLDACRTNPFARPGARGVGGERGLAPPPQVKGVFSLYAASAGQAARDRLSDDDSNPNSVFSRVLVPALTKPGLDLTALAFDVREEVARIARDSGYVQEPSYYDGTIGGRVYLAGLPPGTDAGQAWAIIQNSTSVAVLDDFIRQFGNAPVYGSMAQARREELAKGLVKPRVDDGPVNDLHDNIATEEATIERLDLQIAVQQANVGQARAQLTSALANQKQVQLEFQRAQALVERQVAPHQTLDRSRINLDQANTAVQSAQAALDSALANSDVLHAQKKEAVRILEELKHRAAASGQQTAAVALPVKPPGPAADVCGGPATVSLQSGCAAPLTSGQERGLKPKDTFRECENCPEMVVVPAGSFTMGSPENEKDRDKNEGPQHTVTIAKAFAVGKVHVTVDQFAAFVGETGYAASSSCSNGKGSNGSWRDPGIAQQGSHPVVCVSWDDANAYTKWLAKKSGKPYRLLSEAEWEYAARGRTLPGAYPRYWFGDNEQDLCRYGNFGDYRTGAPCKDGYSATSPAGHYPPNAFGLYDMFGNVWQWTEDCWHPDYKGAPNDGSAWTSGCDGSRVVRGGSWWHYDAYLRVAVRIWFTGVDYDHGFRVARTLSP